MELKMAIVNIFNGVNKYSRNPIVISVNQNSSFFHSNRSQRLQPSRKQEGHNHVTDATPIFHCRQRQSLVYSSNLVTGVKTYAMQTTWSEYG